MTCLTRITQLPPETEKYNMKIMIFILKIFFGGVSVK